MNISVTRHVFLKTSSEIYKLRRIKPNFKSNVPNTIVLISSSRNFITVDTHLTNIDEKVYRSLEDISLTSNQPNPIKVVFLNAAMLFVFKVETNPMAFLINKLFCYLQDV